MPKYISPAFLQQCYFSHRDSLVLKEVHDSAIVVRCSDCNFRHSLEVRLKAPSESQTPASGGSSMTHAAAQCVADHLHAVKIQKVNAIQDSIELYCADCFNTYRFTITQCETSEDGWSLEQAHEQGQ